MWSSACERPRSRSDADMPRHPFLLAFLVLGPALGVLGALSAPAGAQGVPAGEEHGPSLTARVAGSWVPLLDPGGEAGRWTAALAALEDAPGWVSTSMGIERGEVTVRRSGEPWRIRVILVRIDPARVDLRLVVPPRREDGYAGRWEVEEAPEEALVAVNAGHFTSGPWGWLVQDGQVRQRPGRGRLAPGIAIDREGQVRIVPQDSLHLLTDVREGFQSYPALLLGDGEVPPELRRSGQGVDLTHRDGRLALGLLRDGRVLLALTRVEGLGGLLEVAPFGPTTPEMAALMGALGSTRAVLLDGGLSGQLLVREDGQARRWRGLRQVAAGLVGLPRSTPVAVR